MKNLYIYVDCVVDFYMKGRFMFSFSTTSPNFCSQTSFAPPPVQRKTQGEIFKEELKEQAKEAKMKDSAQRTVGDYITIGMDTVNNIVDNVPVVHANGASNLNYLA